MQQPVVLPLPPPLPPPPPPLGSCPPLLLVLFLRVVINSSFSSAVPQLVTLNSPFEKTKKKKKKKNPVPRKIRHETDLSSPVELNSAALNLNYDLGNSVASRLLIRCHKQPIYQLRNGLR